MARSALELDEGQVPPEGRVRPWLVAGLVAVVVALSVVGALMLTYGDIPPRIPVAELPSPTATLSPTPSSTPSPTWTATHVVPTPTPTWPTATATPIPPRPTFTPTMLPAVPWTIRPILPTCVLPPDWWAYQVQVGDSLQYLAVLCRTAPGVIMAGNCLTYPVIHVGQIIYLPPSSYVEYPSPTTPIEATGTVPVCGEVPSGWVPYLVRAGDTLYSLARGRGTTVEAIMAANCLPSYDLRTGDLLYLPPMPSTPVATETPPPADDPTPTAASTSVPSPTATATATAAPVPGCAVVPTGALGAIWNSDAMVRSRLRCPNSVESVTDMAEQPFERGKMLWRGDKARVYVFYNTGEWHWFFDSWQEGESPHSCQFEEPPSGLWQPIHGFGRLWCEQPEVREALGWATLEEWGTQGTVQDFEEGVMFDIPGEGIFILYAGSGTWEHR